MPLCKVGDEWAAIAEEESRPATVINKIATKRVLSFAAESISPARFISPMACCMPMDRLAGLMMRLALSLLLLAATPASVSAEAEFDPANVSVVDAINCHVDAPTYNGFAMAIGGEDNLASRLGWRKVRGENPFLAEYELPEPVLVTGTWSTRRIAFSASAVMAILDVADPTVVATGEGIANELETDAAISEIANAAEQAGVASRAEVESDITFRKFLGQRVLIEVTEPATEADGFGTRTVIARSISNVTSHPGKTLYGCSYRIELLGPDGKPL